MIPAVRRTASSVTLALVAGSLSFTLAGAALAKAPGKTYCYKSICHRVKTAAETEALIGFEEVVTASYYDDCKVDHNNPCPPPSLGDELSADLPNNAASPIYPDGTWLVLNNPKTNATVLVRVNSAGPYVKGRMLDVSRAAAEQLGFVAAGTAQLKVTVIRSPQG